jgi:hypothetical protein
MLHSPSLYQLHMIHSAEGVVRVPRAEGTTQAERGVSGKWQCELLNLFTRRSDIF